MPCGHGCSVLDSTICAEGARGVAKWLRYCCTFCSMTTQLCNILTDNVLLCDVHEVAPPGVQHRMIPCLELRHVIGCPTLLCASSAPLLDSGFVVGRAFSYTLVHAAWQCPMVDPLASLVSTGPGHCSSNQVLPKLLFHFVSQASEQRLNSLICPNGMTC